MWESLLYRLDDGGLNKSKDFKDDYIFTSHCFKKLAMNLSRISVVYYTYLQEQESLNYWNVSKQPVLSQSHIVCSFSETRLPLHQNAKLEKFLSDIHSSVSGK